MIVLDEAKEIAELWPKDFNFYQHKDGSWYLQAIVDKSFRAVAREHTKEGAEKRNAERVKERDEASLVMALEKVILDEGWEFLSGSASINNIGEVVHQGQKYTEYTCWVTDFWGATWKAWAETKADAMTKALLEAKRYKASRVVSLQEDLGVV